MTSGMTLGRTCLLRVIYMSSQSSAHLLQVICMSSLMCRITMFFPVSSTCHVHHLHALALGHRHAGCILSPSFACHHCWGIGWLCIICTSSPETEDEIGDRINLCHPYIIPIVCTPSPETGNDLGDNICHLQGLMGRSYSLNIFTENICKWIASYLSAQCSTTLWWSSIHLKMFIKYVCHYLKWC